MKKCNVSVLASFGNPYRGTKLSGCYWCNHVKECFKAFKTGVGTNNMKTCYVSTCPHWREGNECYFEECTQPVVQADACETTHPKTEIVIDKQKKAEKKLNIGFGF